MSARRWVLASGNDGKRRELEALLAPLGIVLSAQSAWGLAGVPETGESFVENALLKARAAARATGLPAIGDDSGLIVDALDGAPGLRSARYAAESADDRADDQANIDRLLAALADTPVAQRCARFVCVLVVLGHAADPDPLVARGVWEGRIATAPRGGSGFGYDPVFEIPGLGKTAAELPAAEKNRLSHRARALGALRAQLASR
ncbi:MAG: RdgB/HAM1 family non-canonical purine NTP pyrophosphatase [Gammaproteobacteria bacterium]|nr:MAG: RdgB/HAM1 family non-canonical purine NTP pyrophosphatase [Gammaproteobacteria bacterium]